MKRLIVYVFGFVVYKSLLLLWNLVIMAKKEPQTKYKLMAWLCSNKTLFTEQGGRPPQMCLLSSNLSDCDVTPRAVGLASSFCGDEVGTTAFS